MTRFYTRYEIEKKEKQLKEDVLFNASNYKGQLKDALNVENHRVNVDSAKKKAVTQGMDYNGFHQMVLGANLKGSKTSELLELKPKAPIMNNVMTQNLLGKEIDVLSGNFVVANSENSGKSLENLKVIEKLKSENVFVDANDIKVEYQSFKKMLKNVSNTEDKIKVLLATINYEELIQSNTLESDIFLDVICSAGSFILTDFKTIDKDTLNFLLKFVNILISHNQFSSLKKFIGKKHKTIYNSLNEIKSQIFTDEEILNNFEFIFNSITK